MKPAIEENPTMFDDLWNKPAMLIGLGLAGIAIILAAGICCSKMFAKNKNKKKLGPRQGQYQCRGRGPWALGCNEPKGSSVCLQENHSFIKRYE